MKFMRGAVITAALAALLGVASAQDLGSILRNVIRKPGGLDDILSSLRSISDVSLGQTPGGAAAPNDADGKVVLYRTAWCGYCKQASAYMKERSIPVSERDIEANPGYRAEYKQLGGKGGVPLIVMGSKTMAGFNPSSFDQAYASYRPATESAPREATPKVAVSSTPGGIFRPRIGNVKLYEQPDDKSRVVATLQKTDELIATGEAREGFLKVDAASASSAWVRSTLVEPVR